MSAQLKHGHYAGGVASPTYTSWQNMRTRCLNPKDPTYPKYGGAGITVCKRWDRFENFLADMGIRPEGRTLDRKDGAKGYSKRNCRWATRREQAQNRSVNKRITFQGVTLCMAEWARRLGHNVQVLKGRFRRGFSVSQALTTPSRGPGYKRTRCAK